MPGFTDAALALLQKLEGLRLTAYADEGGVATIGYGHTGSDVHLGLTWTQDQATAALESDVQIFTRGVQNLVHVDLTDNQFSALVIFAYNVGLQALAGSTVLRRVNNKLFGMVPADIAAWCHVHNAAGQQVVSPGLKKRRAAEISLWNS